MSATDGVKSGQASFIHDSSYIWMLYSLHLFVAHENKNIHAGTGAQAQIKKKKNLSWKMWERRW